MDFVYPPGGACPGGQTGRISASRSAVRALEFRDTHGFFSSKKKKKMLPCAQNGFSPNFVFVLPFLKKSSGSSQSGTEYLQNGCVKKSTSPEGLSA